MASSGTSPASFEIRKAGEDDLSAILSLVNQAFTVERFFLAHERTNSDQLSQLFERGVFLLAEDSTRTLAGLIYVELRGERGYFGLLSVDPQRQRGGLGKLLVARKRECAAMEITVVNLRTELPPFYRKLGYAEVGTAPLHEGMTVTQPAHLIIMSKPL
jgi:N-acetylglutamate synthase-like GNAT family acetyltransferase